jgi:biotin-(acetyl-CoA carboxylase) ligase
MTLDKYVENVTIKWPNDIYWNDRKLGGILIENSIQGGKLKSMIVGVGLNVNQKIFTSDASQSSIATANNAETYQSTQTIKGNNQEY